MRDLNHTFARLQAGFDRQVQFTADASHELRTPVAVVITQTQTALARERTAAEYRESLLACQRAAQRMRGLIDSLLTLARLDAGGAPSVHAPCDLEPIVSEAVELLRPLALAQNLKLELDLRPVCCPVDGGQIAQVVTNLVGNAIAYNRPGGTIRVTLAPGFGEGILTVADTGQGIDSTDLPHVFDRFYRADKARAGKNGHAGLGLAITQSIVTAHGGSIGVTSVLGQGATFTVRLPT